MPVSDGTRGTGACVVVVLGLLVVLLVGLLVGLLVVVLLVVVVVVVVVVGLVVVVVVAATVVLVLAEIVGGDVLPVDGAALTMPVVPLGASVVEVDVTRAASAPPSSPSLQAPTATASTTAPVSTCANRRLDVTPP